MSKHIKIHILCLLTLFCSVIFSFVYFGNIKAYAATPTASVQLYSENSSNIVSSGSTTNKQFGVIVESPGNVYIRFPNQQTEMRYVNSTLTFTYSQNGLYTVYRYAPTSGTAQDLDIKIIYDNVAPAIALKVNDNPALTDSYVTGNISALVSDATSGIKKFEVRKNGAEYTSYKNELMTDDATYEFRAVDNAGNESYATITKDTTQKVVSLANVSNQKTTQDVLISWIDELYSAPIISVTINDLPVSNSTKIKTINGGKYKIVSLDAAGNLWETEFTAFREDIDTTTANQYWWEAKDIDKNTYSFETYNNAFSFAELRERGLIKTRTWNSATWDTGYIMDSADAINAKNGTFFLYKKFDNPSIEVAYFTLERLNQVIKLYAEQGINKYYYWEKNPAEAYIENNLNSLVTSGTIISKSIALRSDLTYKIDGQILTGTSYSVSGTHTLFVYDDFGNSYSYIIKIIRNSPELLFSYDSENFYSTFSEQPYYLKNSIIIKVDETLDNFSMAIIKNSSGSIVAIIGLNEELILSETGKYIVQTINHYGSNEYVFYISQTPPTAEFKDNERSKRLELSVEPSKDAGITLMAIEIYRSDNGTNWTFLTKDDYETVISTEIFKYYFFKTGYYKIVIEDSSRSGIDAIVSHVFYEKPDPEIAHVGINENGYSVTSVTFSWTDEAYAILVKNRFEAAYISGTEITEEGSYELIFRDYNGYEKHYFFIIDRTVAQPISSEEIINGYCRQNSVTWDKEDTSAVLYKDNIELGDYLKGTLLTENGQYKIVLVDTAGNTSFIEFTIDNILPTVELSGVENGGTTTSNVELINLSKEADIKAYINGVEFEYHIGDVLSQAGKYVFVLTDQLGNFAEYSFEIVYVYSINPAGTIFIVIIITALIGGIVLVIFIRKKSIFKSKNKSKQQPEEKQ